MRSTWPQINCFGFALVLVIASAIVPKATGCNFLGLGWRNRREAKPASWHQGALAVPGSIPCWRGFSPRRTWRRTLCAWAACLQGVPKASCSKGPDCVWALMEYFWAPGRNWSGFSIGEVMTLRVSCPFVDFEPHLFWGPLGQGSGGCSRLLFDHMA